ncbi:MAG TPA: hypothetical protein VGB09_06260 [Candidatus Binatia bacterium]
MEAQRSSGIARDESSLTPDERVSSLFQPDTLLSTQYFENLRRKTFFEPEKRLMLAILEDGIHCYFDNLHASGNKRKRLFENAAAWIIEDDGDWVFSFESVCDALGLNPEYVRQGLLRWKERNAKPGGRFENPAVAQLAG